MALAGSLAGAAVGVGLQQALPGCWPTCCRWTSRRRSPGPRSRWAWGWGSGWRWCSRCFPLLAVRRVPPLAALRRDYEAEPRPRDPWRWVGIVALAASTVALAAIQVGSLRQGAIFAAGVGGRAAGALGSRPGRSSARARRWLPSGWPYLWRQGLANLHRPANQTVTVVLAIGFGAFLLGTLVLVQLNLLRQLRLTGGPARPNLVLFDIQPDQLSASQRELRDAGLSSAAGRCPSCRCGSPR